MQFRLRSLLLLIGIAPPLMAQAWFYFSAPDEESDPIVTFERLVVEDEIIQCFAGLPSEPLSQPGELSPVTIPLPLELPELSQPELPIPAQPAQFDSPLSGG
jgi:hypothetical protein